MVRKYKVRILVLPLFILLICQFLFSACSRSRATIETDARAALEEAALGSTSSFEYSVINGTLYKNDVKVPSDVTYLDLTGCHFGDFSFLEQFKQLEQLNLSNTDFTDLSCIAKLNELYELSLSNCTSVSDLEPLTDLTNLRTLLLCGTAVKDLSPLSNLSNLESLSLRDLSTALELSPLFTLPNLRSLQICVGEEFSELIRLSQLTKLSISINEKTNLTPLSTLTKLKSLRIVNNSDHALDLTPISKLEQLNRLCIIGEAVNYIPLSTLSDLEMLTIWSGDNTEFTDIVILSNMKKLHTLQISSGTIENISDMADYELPSLRLLCLTASISEEDKLLLSNTFSDCDIIITRSN